MAAAEKGSSRGLAFASMCAAVVVVVVIVVVVGGRRRSSVHTTIGELPYGQAEARGGEFVRSSFVGEGKKRWGRMG
jgi:hypothetical protein